MQNEFSRKLIFITGKGGVGKTSFAKALAMAQIFERKKTLYTSFSPVTTDNSNYPSLELKPQDFFRQYLEKFVPIKLLREAIQNNSLLHRLVDAAPGMRDTLIAGKLVALAKSNQYDSVIVDLPSSGHSLTFFESLKGVQNIFDSGFVRREIDGVLHFFESCDCQLVIVTRPETLPIQESEELLNQLVEQLCFSKINVVLNGCIPENLTTPDQDLSSDAKTWFNSRLKLQQDAIEHFKKYTIFKISEWPAFEQSQIVLKTARFLRGLE